MEFFFLYRRRERDRSLRRGSSIILFWSSRQTRCGVGAVLTRCSLQSSVSQQQVAKSTCACVYIAPRMKSRQSTRRQGRCGWTKKSPAWRLVGLKSNRIKTFLGYESASLDYHQSGKQVRILSTSFSTTTSSFFSGRVLLSWNFFCLSCLSKVRLLSATYAHCPGSCCRPVSRMAT